MRFPDNLEAVCELSPDYVGFIFYPRSKRFVDVRTDQDLFRIPGPGIKKVGVFVDEDIHRIMHIYETCELSLVQLHGNETVDECRELKEAGIPLLKAFDPSASQALLNDFEPFIDYYLFDTPGPGKGGSGRKFDWTLLDGLNLPHPFFLGGGIAPSDAGVVEEVKNEAFLAVDVNSRFELSPGRKDIQALSTFIKQIRK